MKDKETMNKIKEKLIDFLLGYGFYDTHTYNYEVEPKFGEDITFTDEDSGNTYAPLLLEYDNTLKRLNVIYYNKDDERDFFPKPFNELTTEEIEVLGQMVSFIIETR